jgi:glycosyltransferase involved in cell wall biosynthesis
MARVLERKKPKVAIVHDWLIGGGAERVVYALHKMYPDAPIYTSYCTEEWRKKMDNKVVTGFLQHGPFPKLRKFIPFLRIWWFTRLNLSGYDLVISSSGAEAKGIRVPQGTLHVNYCHAPTHYYWSRYDEYMKHPGFGIADPLARLGLRLLAAPLRRWDLRAAKRPDVMIANSTHIQKEIKKYYGRDSVVIFPPIDLDRFGSEPFVKKRKGFLIAGRQTPYKRIDLAVQACTKLNVPLTVIGRGPDHSRLVTLAGPSIRFLTGVTDPEMPRYFVNAKAFLFPAVDDFGVVAVEALSAGTPLIAYKAGGALDYVDNGKTGLFFEEQTVESLMKVLQKVDTHSFDEAYIRQYAKLFSPMVFRKRITDLIEKLS